LAQQGGTPPRREGGVHFSRAGRRRLCNSQRGHASPTASRWAVVCSAGQRSKATVLWGSPDCPARAAARAFGPGATNPRATTDGGQHFFQAGKRCHSLRAGRRRLCNTTGLNFATTGIPGLPSTCRTQHVPSAQVLLTPVLRLTAGSTSSRQEEGVTPSEREEGVYVTLVVTGLSLTGRPLLLSVFRRQYHWGGSFTRTLRHVTPPVGGDTGVQWPLCTSLELGFWATDTWPPQHLALAPLTGCP
jgi:hypothetical protein